MPIYMDRHYIKGATRHAVENAHQKDLEIQDHYGVNIKTYWFDEKRSTAFCLADAPSKEAVQHVHSEAHGLVPHEIIEVDLAVVETFLGRIKDNIPVKTNTAADGAYATSAFRTIMFTDLQDSTATTIRLGDTNAMHLLRIHNALTRNALREHNGSEVKHTGDGFMASFVSVSDAVKCSIAIQQAFNAYNKEAPDEQMHVRIGLSAGEPVQEDGDLFGATVQLAARLCNHAEPGKILIAQIVRDQCQDEMFSFLDLGEVRPKGFDHSVRLYEVRS